MPVDGPLPGFLVVHPLPNGHYGPITCMCLGPNSIHSRPTLGGTQEATPDRPLHHRAGHATSVSLVFLAGEPKDSSIEVEYGLSGTTELCPCTK